ncbi:MAG: hypothetical protein FWD88_05375 [Treponema sp.]|nr:hypothetical protein [Treponema sp.]
MGKARAVYGLLAPLLLIAGVCVYLVFRDLSGLLFFEWVPFLGFAKGTLVHLEPSVFADIVKFNLAGMLWLVSGVLFLRFVWFHRIATQRVYVWCFYALGALVEISQLSEKVPGTFDLLDLAFMGAGALVEGLIYKAFAKRRIV